MSTSSSITNEEIDAEITLMRTVAQGRIAAAEQNLAEAEAELADSLTLVPEEKNELAAKKQSPADLRWWIHHLEVSADEMLTLSADEMLTLWARHRCGVPMRIALVRSARNAVNVAALESAWPQATVGGVYHGTTAEGEIRTAKIRIALRRAGLHLDTYLGVPEARAALQAEGIKS